MITPPSALEDVRFALPFPPSEFARLQCTVYLELLRLAARVLRQYSRAHLASS